MCDTVVVVPESGPVWFGKNSDREPSEAQFLEAHDELTAAEGRPEELPRPERPARILLSRPCWMWGGEMGVNEHGVAIGNEAVFTKIPVPKAGHTGMDLLRAALESSKSADDALDVLIELVERLVQGGRMGHRQRGFRYHSSFLIADPSKAWILETAGHFWAAKRVHGVATISNVLSITEDFDRVHRNAYRYAKEQGWLRGTEFDFADAFSNRAMSALSGGYLRQACTRQSLDGLNEVGVGDFITALTDHGGAAPTAGWRSEAPCAHASWLPTRRAAQTTASIIARLAPSMPQVWATGTSSPCLSAFKPAQFDTQRFAPRPIADSSFSDDELWWLHERLHRACLVDYEKRRAAFASELGRFQQECLGRAFSNPWAKHAELVTRWTAIAQEQGYSLWRPAAWYWGNRSRRDQIPLGQLTPVPPSPQ